MDRARASTQCYLWVAHADDVCDCCVAGVDQPNFSHQCNFLLPYDVTVKPEQERWPSVHDTPSGGGGGGGGKKKPFKRSKRLVGAFADHNFTGIAT